MSRGLQDIAQTSERLSAHSSPNLHRTTRVGKGSAMGTSRLAAARIRRAMAMDQLVLLCQPLVDCQTGRIEAAESLIRWRHRNRRLIPPGPWIDAVENSRLRDAFNLHVIELAIRQRDEWLAEGVDVPLSVNVTPASLAVKRFVESVAALFADRSPRDAIRLEITERTTVINSDTLRANIDYLSAQGFQFVLDDFGAGYSSLIRLANLPVATLKIDGSLIGEVQARGHHCSIVESLSGLAHTLGLGVVAEGVEDHHTWEVLQQLGCDRVQGYLIARPMPAAAFPRFLREYEPAPPGGLDDRRDRNDRVALSDRRTSDRRTGWDRRAPSAPLHI
jgi:EAL domain-containing protein (putative c-di-GMP-specific phosphodiesterase class I)